MKTVLGIIGGSGVYNFPMIEDLQVLEIDSPWGQPSHALRKGRVGKTEVVFLSRHGEGHRIPPSEINYRANIDCLKRAGVTDLVALSACGSFRDELPPGAFVLVDQFIDHTYRRASSFFGTGCVGHVSMADPVSPNLVERLADASKLLGFEMKRGGTYLAIEGPHFSTRAESLLFKSFAADIIGMTAMPEAKLAREAEIPYALMAMVTDFDCWHSSHANVDAAMVMQVMQDNSKRAQQILACFAKNLPEEHELCPIGSDHALDHAIMTRADAIDPLLKEKLGAILARVLKSSNDDIAIR